jgi:DNA (cytosine-5)-methyltransferase 1
MPHGGGNNVAALNRLVSVPETIKFIDLFAGLGGLRVGLERAANASGLEAECVFTSEIKPHAIKAYELNFPGEVITGDITQVAEQDIPNFDVLLAGFPCQPFSSAGKGLGFSDTRGTLFFEIERILKHHSPRAFILENVEGLVTHDRRNKTDKIGNTLTVVFA